MVYYIMYKLKYLKMKEKYLSLKNQSSGAFTPPQGVQQSDEQRERREASERAALLEVDRRLVLQEVDRVRDALRKRRTPAIDKLPSDVFYYVLSYLSLKELSNMFVAFNQPNSKDVFKAKNIKYFITKRVEKILEFMKKKKDMTKQLSPDDVLEITCSCAPLGFLGLSATATLKTLPKFEGIEYTRVIRSSRVTILFWAFLFNIAIFLSSSSVGSSSPPSARLGLITSVEALTDSLQKLSTDEIEINIIHKGVGAITESDVLLASASDAIVIGFNVRPMGNAREIAEKEEIDIRSYSIIYDAINDVKDAMEGMLSPEMREEITGNVEIRETFKISKVGTIAGCMVTSGKIFRNSNIRIIREGVVIFTGDLISLKRFKDDVKEVAKGYDCGLQINNYNDIKIGDTLECFQEIAIKKSL